MQIVGHTFIVTGGSSGLGAGTAQRLVEAGGNVVLADVNVAGGEAMATELGGQAAFVRTDVTNEGDVQTAVSTTIERFGGLHGVVNCAGIAIAARTLSRSGPHDLAAFSRVIQINLIGTFNMIRLAANHMINNEPMGEIGERGVIINTASVVAFRGTIGMAAYCSSKAAVVMLTKVLALEGAPAGIRVNCICPGFIDTPMNEWLGAIQPDQEGWLEQMLANIPLHRAGTPAEVARANLFLASPDSTYMTGQSLILDGGVLA